MKWGWKGGEAMQVDVKRVEGSKSRYFDGFYRLPSRIHDIPYYGAYANSAGGKLRKRQEGEPIPTVLEPPISSEAFRHNWARLIQKVYEVSPLACPRCKKQMRVVAVIDNIEVIRRILEHLGLWSANARPFPGVHSPPGLRPHPSVQFPDARPGLPLFSIRPSPQPPSRAQFSPPTPKDHTTSCILSS